MLVFYLRLSKFNIEGLITTSICSQDCSRSDRWFFVHADARFIIKILRHHSHVISVIIIGKIIIISLLGGCTIRKIVLVLILLLL